jgi:hypothetical protein
MANSFSAFSIAGAYEILPEWVNLPLHLNAGSYQPNSMRKKFCGKQND